MTDVTRILSAIAQGDLSAAEQLLPLVYGELRKLAAAKMAQEKPGQTLQATALVHEAYLRLVADEAAIATAVKNFIKDDLLAQADPANEPDREITLRTVLDRAAERVAGRFPAKPVVEASILDTLGHTYLGLGAYDEAGKHFARALKSMSTRSAR